MPFHLVSLSDLDAHGDVYLDDSLGSLVVSGSSVYYIAEEKRPKAVSFTKGFGATFKPAKGYFYFLFFLSVLSKLLEFLLLLC